MLSFAAYANNKGTQKPIVPTGYVPPAIDEAATMEYLNKVDDQVLHKASQLCYGLIADFDNDNASLGDKAHIKGTDGYEKGLKEHIRDARSGDFLVQKCTHT